MRLLECLIKLEVVEEDVSARLNEDARVVKLVVVRPIEEDGCVEVMHQ
jgi:hypothetical protein